MPRGRDLPPRIWSGLPCGRDGLSASSPQLERFMTRTSLDRPRIETLSRRQALELAGGATVFTFWHRKAHGLPVPGHYIDHLAAERIADRAPPRPPILIDAQTHVWWRAGGIRQMSERGEHFLKSLARRSVRRSGTESSQTLCWRRQSRANPSLKPKFPASRENTGNFIDSGLGRASTVEKTSIISTLYGPIPYASEQGICYGLAGNLNRRSGKFPP